MAEKFPEYLEDRVDAQISDAITQANVTTLGNSPAVSVDQTYLALSQAQGDLFANMVNNQQQLSMSSHAAVIESALQIFNLDSQTDSKK